MHFFPGHCMPCCASNDLCYCFLKILNHQANVSDDKYDEDNNNELFHHVNSFRLGIINHNYTISA